MFESNSPPFSTALRSRLTSGSDELAQSLETKKRKKKEKKKEERCQRSVSKQRALNYQRGCETLAPRKSAKSRGGGKLCGNDWPPSCVIDFSFFGLRTENYLPWCNGTRQKRIVLRAIVNHGIKSLYSRMPLTRRTFVPERASKRASERVHACTNGRPDTADWKKVE